MQLDLTDVGGDDFGPIEEGYYVARVHDVSHETSQSGNPYLSWEFKITDGSEEGRHVWHNTSLQQQALFALKDVLIAVFPDTDFDREIDTAEIAEKALGNEVRIYCEPDEYNGKTTTNVTAIHPHDGGSDNVVDASSSSTTANAEVEEEEEIPF